MGLEEVLMELGAKEPFDKDGDLTESGEEALEKLIRIVGGLYQIGAIREKPDIVEAYCDEIVRLGF